MPIDPSIPLSVRNPEFMSPAQAVSLQQLARQGQMQNMEMQDYMRQRHEQNAIKQVLQRPGSIKQGGMIDEVALSDITRISPDIGIKLGQQQLHAQSNMVKERLIKLEINDRQNDIIAKNITGLYSQYKDSNVPKEYSAQSYREKFLKKVDELDKTGDFSPQQIDVLRRSSDPSEALGIIGGTKQYKDYLSEQHQKTTEETAQETPYMKELKAKLVAQGLKEGTPEYQKQFSAGLTRRTSREESPTATQLFVGDQGKEANKALDIDIDRYLQTGTLPANMGRGLQGQQQARNIRKAAEEKAKEIGIDPADLPMRWTNFKQYGAVIRDFKAGPTARNITNLNQALGHMGTLWDLNDALQNGDVRLINAVVNRVKAETGDPAINNAQLAAQAVSNELMRVFRQVGASEVETKEFETRFSTSAAPAQQKGALKVGAKLLNSRINALNAQWKRGMEVDKPFPNMLTDESQDTLKKVGLGEMLEKPASAHQEGQRGTSKSGKSIIFKNGNWEYE